MIYLDGSSLTIDQVVEIARNKAEVGLSEEAKKNIQISRDIVEKNIEEKKVIYGLNTGFGKFVNVAISENELDKLQLNLILSDAVGVGDPFKQDVTRAIMLLRVNALAKGFSGIRLSTVETMIAMLNKGVHPVIPEKGSVGSSGDLCPLAHMVLPMIGEGEAEYQDKVLEGREAMEAAGIPVVTLKAKEGLALINGTCAMLGVASLAIHDAEILTKMADITSALTVDSLEGIIDPYDPRIQMVRPHKGQIDVAANMLQILQDSKLTTRQGQIRVQDAYSLRCCPQIHGASKDAVNYVKEHVNIEINSVTDNPIIFKDDRAGISGGNFHGQPMALSFDFLKIAESELANVAERRIERLVNPAYSGLPAFLTPNGGVNSGFMIVQYSAAALVSENKVLAHPASVDSIPSSAGQEDHVSMGANAATKLYKVMDNLEHILAIELMNAAQGIDFRRPLKTSPLLESFLHAYRKEVPFVKDDIVMYKEIHKTVAFLKRTKLEY